MNTPNLHASNPLLSPALLPDFPAIVPAHVVPAVEAVIAEYRSEVERLVADASARDFDALVAPLEKLDEKLSRTWSPVSHLHGVKDSPELRAVYAEADELITEFTTELGQHRGLYEAMQAVRDGVGFASLDRAQRTLIDDSLRGFRNSGVALEEPARTRFREIQTELSKLDTAFEEAVLDASEAWTLVLDEAHLAGLPPSARDLLAGQAKAKGVDGFLATLKGPVVQALLTYADDLFAKMTAARHFHAGLFLVRQLEFALFDFRLHLDYDPARGPRTLDILDDVRAEVSVITPPAWHRFPHAFTHVFAGGYAAGYYSYLWAEVLSADAFGAFEDAAQRSGSVFDAATGQRYRREILAVGGSRPALESFIAFRGREPDPTALLKSYGLAA
jgi:Zn-dependent oligopeptidase